MATAPLPTGTSSPGNGAMALTKDVNEGRRRGGYRPGRSQGRRWFCRCHRARGGGVASRRGRSPATPRWKGPRRRNIRGRLRRQDYEGYQREDCRFECQGVNKSGALYITHDGLAMNASASPSWDEQFGSSDDRRTAGVPQQTQNTEFMDLRVSGCRRDVPTQ